MITPCDDCDDEDTDKCTPDSPCRECIIDLEYINQPLMDFDWLYNR